VDLLSLQYRSSVVTLGKETCLPHSSEPSRCCSCQGPATGTDDWRQLTSLWRPSSFCSSRWRH